MAKHNLQRSADFHKKRDVSVMALVLNGKDLKNDGLSVTDEGVVAQLPKDIIITGIQGAIVTPGATGFGLDLHVGGVSQLTIVADVVAVVFDPTKPKAYPTGTEVSVFNTANNNETAVIYIEYLEYTKTTGELTRINETVV